MDRRPPPTRGRERRVERVPELVDPLGMQLDGEQIAALVCELEHMQPLRRQNGLREPKPIEQDLVVRHRNRDVHQTLAQSRPDGGHACVDRAVQPERQRVTRGGGRIDIGREHREDERLAAVIPKPELPDDIARGLVVSKVGTTEPGGSQTRAREDVDGARDRLALTAAVERGVIAVHESVERELDTAIGVTPQKIRVSFENAGGGRPRRPHLVSARDRLVAVEPAGHRRGRRPEPRYDHGGARERPRRSATLQAHGETHTFSPASMSSGARVRAPSRSTIST